ncbi:MAG: hypothetical protein Q8Q79_12600, partial [Sphingopyxis sp.]|nr:hypothetical protein [Sphingopyxis sp.]
VEDDELVGMGREKKLGFCELRPVGIGLKVEINGRPCLAGLERKRRLPDLPGPNQRDSWYLVQPFRQFCCNSSFNHPSNSGVLFQIYKVISRVSSENHDFGTVKSSISNVHFLARRSAL